MTAHNAGYGRPWLTDSRSYRVCASGWNVRPSDAAQVEFLEVRSLVVVMIIRLEATATSILLGWWAFLVAGCSAAVAPWKADGLEIWGCAGTGSGLMSGQWAATVLAATALLILALAWLPAVGRRRSNTSRTMSSLSSNLERVGGNAAGSFADRGIVSADRSAIRNAVSKATERDPGKSATRSIGSTTTAVAYPPEKAAGGVEAGNELRVSISGLQARVDVLEEDLDADSLTPKDAMNQWISLLKDCNQAHNTGTLPASLFKDLNTRLLDLFTTSSTPDTSQPHHD